jgi:hypothetical protein
MADYENLFYNIQSLSDMHRTLEQKINQKIKQGKIGKPIATRPYEDYVRDIYTQFMVNWRACSNSIATY